MVEVGTVCIKTVGREKGRYCVVLKQLDKSFVLATGPRLLTGIKRRRVNINHIQPLQYKLEIKEDASDEEVIEAYKKAGLVAKLGLKLPSAAELKEEKKFEEVKEKEKVKKAEKEKQKKAEKKAKK
jgi:large subunit ribosomal protein L14e